MGSQVDAAIASLDFMPGRCALAPENKFTAKTIHRLPIQIHLILFIIDEEEAKVVSVLSFRGGRQLPKKG